MHKKYYDALDKVQASPDFINRTLQHLEEKKTKAPGWVRPGQWTMGLAVCLAILLTVFGVKQPLGGAVPIGDDLPVASVFDLTDKIVVDPHAPSSSVCLNFEGKIVELGHRGMSFKLDSGQWYYITDDTQVGTSVQSQEDKEQLFIDSRLRVGNQISGFVLEEDMALEWIPVYAIYTNWQWEN